MGSTASVDAGLLSYSATGGEANNVTISLVGAVHRVNDTGTGITAGSGCVTIDANTVDCAGTTSISVSADDLDDTVLVSAPTDSTLIGGADDDSLSGGAGTDTLSGEVGNDILDGGLGADRLSGGADVDTVTFAGRTGDVTADLDNAADDGESGEGDNVRSDVQNVIGGAGNDLLIGSLGTNSLSGGDGNDTLQGGDGEDSMSGDAGADSILSRDTVGDSVFCGSEVDSVIADILDFVSECEVVDRGATGSGDGSGGGSGTGDGGGRSAGPLVGTLSLPKSTVKVTSTGRIRIPLRCQGEVDCHGRLTVATARKLRLAGQRRARRFVLGRRTFSWRAGRRVTVNVRLQRKLHRHLRRKKGLDIRVTARMEAGPSARSVLGDPKVITGIIHAEPGKT